MRIIVCSTQEQRQAFAREFPDDHVVVFGTALYGLRADEVVDETFLIRHRQPNAYWDHVVSCRVKPT